MTALADQRGLDIPRDLERIFIIEELLELEAERENGDDPEEFEVLPRKTDAAELVPLPKHYNITYIDALIRDPLWVFVFWEIKGQDKEIHEKALDFGGYYLKVSRAENPKFPGHTQPVDGDAAFTVPVGLTDTAWYLSFPPGGGYFKVDLRVSRGNSGMLLASTRSFRLPPLLPPPEQCVRLNGLAALSGQEEIPVLRNTDRVSRIPQGWG